MKRSEPEPMNVPGFEGFHRPLTLVTYSISTPLTESAMMSEFIMVNYSQNECSCQHLSSGYLGKLSELGGSPPVPCFGKLPELGAFPSTWNSSHTAQLLPRRKGLQGPRAPAGCSAWQAGQSPLSRSGIIARAPPSRQSSGQCHTAKLRFKPRPPTALSLAGKPTHFSRRHILLLPWPTFIFLFSSPFSIWFHPPPSESPPSRSCLLALRSLQKHGFLRTPREGTGLPAHGLPLLSLGPAAALLKAGVWNLHSYVQGCSSTWLCPVLFCDSEPHSQLLHTCHLGRCMIKPRGKMCMGGKPELQKSKSKWKTKAGGNSEIWEPCHLVMGGYFNSKFNILCYFSFHFLGVQWGNTILPLHLSFQIIFWPQSLAQATNTLKFNINFHCHANSKLWCE